VTAQLAWDLHVNSGGRFALGLGTQVQAHIERRFGVAWGTPGARMEEYVKAVRAVWRTWELGEKLKYTGEHYKLSLMTPEFSPRPSGLTPIPIYTAAVRPAMMRLAARVCDGVRLHGFCTRRYLEEVALREIDAELARVGKERSQFEVCGGGFVATGPNAEAVANTREMIRYRVAFYASTPAYRPVLSLHGWDDLGEKLHRLSVTGGWAQMPGLVTDDVLDHFVAQGTYDELPAAIEARFGGLTDTIELMMPSDLPPGGVREVLARVRAIPAPFVAHAREW
jgi:probable F420-dependent oxidoreductase